MAKYDAESSAKIKKEMEKERTKSEIYFYWAELITNWINNTSSIEIRG